MAPAFLATLDPSALDPSALGSSGLGAGSWWRTIGGLAVVFGLLFLSLKLLSRYGRRGAAAQARMVAVWHLGPRREIQILRLGEEVSYVYKHENAMVLLRQEEWEAYRQQYGETVAAGPAGSLTLPPALTRWFKATALRPAASRD